MYTRASGYGPEMKSEAVEVVRLWELWEKNFPPGLSDDDDDFVELQRHIGQFGCRQNILTASAPAPVRVQ